MVLALPRRNSAHMAIDPMGAEWRSGRARSLSDIRKFSNSCHYIYGSSVISINILCFKRHDSVMSGRLLEPCILYDPISVHPPFDNGKNAGPDGGRHW